MQLLNVFADMMRRAGNWKAKKNRIAVPGIDRARRDEGACHSSAQPGQRLRIRENDSRRSKQASRAVERRAE